MGALPREAELRAMIEEALKQCAPHAYCELKASGSLRGVLDERAQAARKTYDQLWNGDALQAMSVKRKLPGLEVVREVTLGRIDIQDSQRA